MELSNNLKRLVAEKKEATERLEKAIFAEIDKIARRTGIDEISYGLNTYYTIDGDRWITGDLNHEHEGVRETYALEHLYWDEIHASGFQALWSKDKGWH